MSIKILILEYIFVGILGLCFGSFVTMASHRLPNKQDIVLKPSYCPSCNHRLGVLDLIPLFSWLTQRGKCRYCKAHVSFRYPAIEMVTSLLCVGVFHSYGVGYPLLIGWAIAISLMIACVVELEGRAPQKQCLWIASVLLIAIGIARENGFLEVQALHVQHIFVALSLAVFVIAWRYALLHWEQALLIVAAMVFSGENRIIPFFLVFAMLGMLAQFARKNFKFKQQFPVVCIVSISLFAVILWMP